MKMFSMLSLTPEQRRDLVSRTAECLGGKKELGRRLGYRDGAFVGQMIRGERPVSEKTLRLLGSIPKAREIAQAMCAGLGHVPLTEASPRHAQSVPPLEHSADFADQIAEAVASMGYVRWAMVRTMLDIVAAEPAHREEAKVELRRLLGAGPNGEKA